MTDTNSPVEAVAARAAWLDEVTRRAGLGTDHVSVFYHTGKHDRRDPRRAVSTVVTLPETTSDSPALIKAAIYGVAKFWRE